MEEIVTTRSTQRVMAPPDLSSVSGGGSGVCIVAVYVRPWYLVLGLSWWCCIAAIRVFLAFVSLASGGVDE